MPQKKPEIEWTHALTLGAYIVRLVKEKRTDSDEFKLLVSYYGRERLLEIYKLEMEKGKRNGV